MELSWLLKVAGTLLVCYALVVAGCATFQRSLLYFPGPELPAPAEAGAADMRPVTLNTADGLALTAWYAPAAENRATIAYFHGNAGNIAYRVDKTRALRQSGYGLLLVEYRGYGGNPGSPTEDGLYADAEAAYAFLTRTQGIAPERIVLKGESLGSGVAVWLAQKVDVGAVMLEAPYTSITDVAQRAYFFLPVRLLAKDRFEAVDRIADIDAPLLIVHGNRDRVIDVEFGQALFAAAVEPKTLRIIQGGSHNDLPAFGLEEIELDFLARVYAGS